MSKIRYTVNEEKKQISFAMNQNRIVLDMTTGAIISMRRPGCPEFVAAPCGLVDLAWPVHLEYDLLRLQPCGKYEKVSPTIQKVKDEVVITYHGMSKNLTLPEREEMVGGVETAIRISPDPDGQSLMLRCTVTNHSDTPVRQILFPNLEGLAAVSGEENARFTTMLFHMNPYVEQDSNEHSRERFYGENRTVAGQFFSPAGLFPANGADRAMGGRWWDYGSLRAGLSLYRQAWGWGPENKCCMGSNDTYWVKLNQDDRTMRIASIQYLNLGKEETYDSGVYVLTLHTGAWVKGVQPYKKWFKAHQKRVVPVPKCMKEWMGFRTIWMGSGYPDDPEDTVWKYTDFPRLADDIAAHGLSGMNLWGWNSSDYFPITEKSIIPQYGGIEELKKNVKVCKEKGVEVYPLVSYVQLWYKQAIARGLPINASWAETVKAIPVFRAPYMKRWSSYDMPNLNQDWWIDGTNQSLRFVRDELGMPSIAWDQYCLQGGNDALHEVINAYRLETTAMYPEAHFSGESTFYMESDVDNCDTQWTWLWWNQGMTDYRPYLYVVETERPNMNVDSSPLFAKYIFMDNLMMNAYPSKPGQMNGSAMIADYPAFSEALKHLGAMRKTYMPYFTDGDNLGDCVLTRECNRARVGFYQLKDSMLAFAVLGEKVKNATFYYDLSQYIDASIFEVEIRDECQTLIETRRVAAKGALKLSGESCELFAITFRPIKD